jgi:hypothetical protein
MWSGAALADPWLVSDPNPGATVYRITGLPWVTDPVDARSDGSLAIDLASAQMDVAYSIQVEAGNVWGYAAPVPYLVGRITAVPFICKPAVGSWFLRLSAVTEEIT